MSMMENSPSNPAETRPTVISEAWIQHTQNRAWEIFWKKDCHLTPATNSSSPSQQRAQPKSHRRPSQGCAVSKRPRAASSSKTRKRPPPSASSHPRPKSHRDKSKNGMEEEEEMHEQDDDVKVDDEEADDMDEEEEEDWYDATIVDCKFQEDPTPPSVNTTTASLDPTTPAAGEDATAEKSNPFQVRAQVRFVGEESEMYEMTLTLALVRPRQPKPNDPADRDLLSENPWQHLSREDWMQTVVGKDCEVFWKSQCSERNPFSEKQVDGEDDPEEQDDDDDDGEEEDVEDWYAASVQEFQRMEGPDKAIFKVYFVGDETLYEMALNPQLVRPSARAWIRRSKVLLDGPAQKKQQRNRECWEQSLPKDTSLLEDTDELERIRKHVCEQEFPEIQQSWTGRSPMIKFPTMVEHEWVGRFIEVIREQIYLRSQLAPVVHVEEDSMDDEDDFPISESYINYLVHCLRELESACRWHYLCWKLHCQLLRSNVEDQAAISRDHLIQECLMGGRRVMNTLISMDTSFAGSKRKRPPYSPQPSGTRRTKRRRKMKGFTDFWHEGESGQRTFNEDLDEEDFLSTDMVRRLVDKIESSDHRWFVKLFGTMMKSLSGNIIAPFIRWERLAQYYLGDIETSDVEASDGETDQEGADDYDDVEEENRSVEPESRRYLTLEEILSAVDTARNNAILKKCAPVGLVERLEQKVEQISSFESRAWKEIGLVLSDDSVSPDGKQDTILASLQALRDEAIEGNVSLRNVEPLGRAPSSLTRAVLQNALVYRRWYVDLRQAESRRERVAFVDDIVSRMSNLPALPCSPGIANIATFDLSETLKKIAPRVQSLSTKCIDHVAMFSHYKSMLCENSQQDSGCNMLLSIDDATKALGELRLAPVVSLAEEMLSIRVDIIEWHSNAESVLARVPPSFSKLTELKSQLELVLTCQSLTRMQSVQGLRPNPTIDIDVRDFARKDIEHRCRSLVERTNALFAASSGWKDKADTILLALRAFGNEKAGEPFSAQKPLAMVDLKRINDLLEDYKNLEVEIPMEVGRLKEVSEESSRWSTEMTSCLLDDERSFEDCLSSVKGYGRERPKGVIVSPTRQVIDSLEELLSWYVQVKEALSQSTLSADELNHLVVEGFEVLVKYNESRGDVGKFFLRPESIELISGGSRKVGRCISRVKLEGNPLSNEVLNRMTRSTRDVREAGPLLSLLFWVWKAHAGAFLSRVNVAGSDRVDITLAHARELLSQKPSFEGETTPALNPPMFRTEWEVESMLKDAIKEAVKTEESARQILLESKSLLRDASRRLDEVRSHLTTSKELQAEFKSRANFDLQLDKALELQLENDIKVFTWLGRILPYPFLLTNAAAYVSGDRIPWDILVILYERIPSYDEDTGDFACIRLRVKELYEGASAWQEEISSLTMLSLRGGKRRMNSGQTPTKGNAGSEGSASDEEEQSSSTIEVDKLVELSQHPILQKVNMPREAGIRNMVEHTKQFEIQLYEFLGKDYDGPGPDRAAYPTTGSLVDNDGTFQLYRLTGSPLFQMLKSSIASISEIAGHVFADTPGKEAFSWICRAVAWIDSMRAAVSKGSPFGGPSVSKLIIPGTEARGLLKEGEQILLHVPDDLRRTLSNHRIYVSTNKDGKLTVKSKKGGAHYAVGTTAIRWCPFLFESLKSDVAKLDKWELAVKTIADSFQAACNSATRASITLESLIHQLYSFRESVSDLLYAGQELVVAPAPALVNNCRVLLAKIDGFLEANSSPAMARTFIESTYKGDTAQVKNRFLLLDSLVKRQWIVREPSVQLPSQVSKEGPFRSAARKILEKALRKGAKSMAIEMEDAASAACSLKAWEIETALFVAFQSELGETRISPEYREKARSLRRSLEEFDNLYLCARVLAGEIDADTLVGMTSEELASAQTKKDRAKAAARKNIVLGGSVTRSSAGPTTDQVPISELKSPPAGSDKSLNNAAVDDDGAVIRDGLSPSTNVSGVDGTPVVDPSSADNNSSRRLSLGDLVRSAAAVGHASRPPPPPALVDSLRVASLRSATPGRRRGPGNDADDDNLVSNTQGGHEIRMAISDSSRVFKVNLVLENGSHEHWIRNGFFPPYLPDTGRLQIPEFVQFVESKWDNERWFSALLRVVPCSEADDRTLRKAARDYDTKERVAMFAIAEKKAKIFWVTPRFHSALADVLPLADSSSTYAIVLLRR